MLDLKSAVQTASQLVKALGEAGAMIQSAVQPDEKTSSAFKALSMVADCQRLLNESPSLSDEDSATKTALEKAVANFTDLVPDLYNSSKDFVSYLNSQMHSGQDGVGDGAVSYLLSTQEPGLTAQNIGGAYYAGLQCCHCIMLLCHLLFATYVM